MVARIFALGAALAAVAQAHPAHGNGTVTGGTAYTTEVVTAITTYCPEATTLTYGDKTYTVTEATTLTITDCPCTLTKPVKPTTTSEEAHTAYTTEVVTAITTYCPAATTLTHGDKTYTVTAPTTLTITDCPCTLTKPVKPTTTPVQPKDECAEHCYMAYNACRVKPDANMSSCAAEYASCVGYNPFGEDGSLVTPTACAAKTPKPTGHAVYTTEVLTAITTYCPAPTTMTFNSKTYTVTEPTTLTITDCPCTVSKPVPSGGSHSEPAQPGSSEPAVPAKDCPAECAKSFDECRYQPDANMSTCSAEYASCLGYNPFAADGSLVTPTACSVEQTGVATMPPAGPATGSATGPATGPEATPSGPAEVPTGDAGRAVPGLVAVLGALALL